MLALMEFPQRAEREKRVEAKEMKGKDRGRCVMKGKPSAFTHAVAARGPHTAHNFPACSCIHSQSNPLPNTYIAAHMEAHVTFVYASVRVAHAVTAPSQ